MLSTCCCQLHICNKNRWNKNDTFLGNFKIELFAEKMLVMFMRKNWKLHFFEVNLGFIANHNSFMSKNYFLLIFSIYIVLLSIVGNSLARLIPLNPFFLFPYSVDIRDWLNNEILLCFSNIETYGNIQQNRRMSLIQNFLSTKSTIFQ